MQPLEGVLVADLSLLLPGAFASRQLVRLGARVVKLEPPGGDPIRFSQPSWHGDLNGGKESIECDLKNEPALGRALIERADIVLDSFRLGVLERLGAAPGPNTVWVSITGFGPENRHEQRAGHDLNYLGWAGVLDGAAPEMPTVTVADYSGGFAAVREILARLYARERTGQGSRAVVSMTHESYELRVPPTLRGAVACYRIYPTADGRWITIAALEPKFWQRLCELLELKDALPRAYEPRVPELEAALAARSLDELLTLFGDEDVCAGPVWTHEEASEFAQPPPPPAPELGEHNDAWQAELLA
jgi:alpha-methylacyl-CoA racemase